MDCGVFEATFIVEPKKPPNDCALAEGLPLVIVITSSALERAKFLVHVML